MLNSLNSDFQGEHGQAMSYASDIVTNSYLWIFGVREVWMPKWIEALGDSRKFPSSLSLIPFPPLPPTRPGHSHIHIYSQAQTTQIATRYESGVACRSCLVFSTLQLKETARQLCFTKKLPSSLWTVSLSKAKRAERGLENALGFPEFFALYTTRINKLFQTQVTNKRISL